jgi:hypothetical protein
MKKTDFIVRSILPAVLALLLAPAVTKAREPGAVTTLETVRAEAERGG